MNLKKSSCGCCTGIEKSTPAAIYNRPGLESLQYRVGDYATFLETMLARLSNLYLKDEHDLGSYPLQKLTTRSPDDFAIALLHGWATVADVLTFYQERLANEGFLRTATERRSVLELARLIGYQPRPGVSASVFLAYTIDDNFKEAALISKGTRAQSIPGAGELPQAFETSDDLLARAAWNNLKPRLTRPQTIENIEKNSPIYLKGISTNLKPNDPLLIEIIKDRPELFRVMYVQIDAIADRTKVMIQAWSKQGATISTTSSAVPTELPQVLTALSKPRSLPPLNSLRLNRNTGQTFAPNTDTIPQLLTAFRPELKPVLYNAWRNLPVTPVATTKVYALRTRASVFGHNAPLEPVKNTDNLVTGFKEWDLKKTTGVTTENFKIVTQIVPSKDILNILGEIQETGTGLNDSNQETGLDISADVTIGSNTLKISQRKLKSETFSDDQNKITVQTVVEKIVEIGFRIEVIYTLPNFPLIKVIYKTERNSQENTTKITVSSENSDPTSSTFIGGATLFEHTLNGTRQISSLSETTEKPNEVYLDAPYAQIIPSSWIVLDRPNAVGTIKKTVISQVEQASERSRADYGITAKSTHITLNKDWLDIDKDTFAVIRGTSVFAQSESLELAEEPIDPVEGAVCGNIIELDGLYDGLESGRWLIVSGERTDIASADPHIPIRGVFASELVMLTGVEQVFDVKLLGDKTHSKLLLAQPLSYCYKRDTIKIYGNVVKATHGETRQEVLGSGNGAKTLQSFTLKQPPLTFVSAENPSGVDSTLKVRVNGVEWHESKSLNTLTPTSRRFISKTDDEGKTTVIFGNGYQGARLPTGIENIKAEYRNGIGKSGNVKAEQISLLVSRPLGVKEVINPLRASGGADKETRDQARKNAPLTVAALDRLVSVQDYQDFSRIYAGIGKAYATELSDGRRQIVHITIAGIEDVPIDESSDLFINLRKALQDFGDPFQAIQLAVRELMLLVISAKVKIHPDYQWELVVAALRTVLLDVFSFERRELGQDVMLAEVISVMQRVAGVVYIDMEAFGGIPEKDEQRQPLTPEQIAEKVQIIAKPPIPHRLSVNLAESKADIIRPAQIAFLTPEVPETLILNQIL
jgi:hypothetical protein